MGAWFKHSLSACALEGTDKTLWWIFITYLLCRASVLNSANAIARDRTSGYTRLSTEDLWWTSQKGVESSILC